MYGAGCEPGPTMWPELVQLWLYAHCIRPLVAGEWNLQHGIHKCIYVAPNKSLVQERVSDWNARMGHLELHIVECTGDSDSMDSTTLAKADVIATTPYAAAWTLLHTRYRNPCTENEVLYREKLDALSRRFFGSDHGDVSFISDVALLLVDEVHMLSEDRGPTLEAGVVCRLRTLGSMRGLTSTNLSNMRILAASATIPNVHDIARWLSVQDDACKVFSCRHLLGQHRQVAVSLE